MPEKALRRFFTDEDSAFPVRFRYRRIMSWQQQHQMGDAMLQGRNLGIHWVSTYMLQDVRRRKFDFQIIHAK
uniref:Uncharacterized protein n=1 Tax=Aegilops tauschii subsp. strangulata TaxID=200361 RepID=A0A453IU38_AEGTS